TVSAGQWLTNSLMPEKSASGQRGTAVGLPSNPGGSLNLKSRGSAGSEGSNPLPPQGSRVRLRSRVFVIWNGCDPASDAAPPPSSSGFSSKRLTPNGGRSASTLNFVA